MFGKTQQRTLQHLFHLIVVVCLIMTGFTPRVLRASRPLVSPSPVPAGETATASRHLLGETTALAAVAIDPGPWHQDAPSLAADSAGNQYAVWADYRAGNPHIRFSYRPAGGAWQPSVQVDPTGTKAQRMPKLAVDGSGNLYAVWDDGRGSARAIYFAYRPFGGTWGASQVISPTTEAQLSPALAVNRRGEVVVAWEEGVNPNYHVWVAVRPVGGPFGPAQRLSAVAALMPLPNVAMDDWGRAYVLWDSGNTSQVLFALRPAGGPWGAVENVRDYSLRTTYESSLAVDSAGNAYAVWGDWRDESNPNIYAAYRPVGGPWSANVRVNDDYGLAATHYSPAVSVDGAGNAIAAWGSTADFFRAELYRAVRPRGGGWGPSVLLASWPSASAPVAESNDTAGTSELATAPGSDETSSGRDDVGWPLSQAVASHRDSVAGALLGEFGLSCPQVAADSQLAIIYTQATYPTAPFPQNVYVDNLAGIGSGGGCHGTMMGPPSGQAASLAADGDERCHAGDAAEAPPLNGDWSNLPGSPLYGSGIIHGMEMDGQQVFVVYGGDGREGIFTDPGDAEAFRAQHVKPDPGQAQQPPPQPPVEPMPAAQPPAPAQQPPDPQPVQAVVTPREDPGPQLSKQDMDRLRNRRDALWLLEESTRRQLTKAEIKQLEGLGGVLPSSAKAVKALHSQLQQIGPNWQASFADLANMTPEGFRRLQKQAGAIAAEQARQAALEEAQRLAALQAAAQQSQASGSGKPLSTTAAIADYQARVRAELGRLVLVMEEKEKKAQEDPWKVTQEYRTEQTMGIQAATKAGKYGVIETYTITDNRLVDPNEATADPVLPHSGEFIQTLTPLSIPGRGLDYQFRLNYRSQLIYNGPVGWGWEHNYDRRMVDAGGGSLALWNGAGRTGIFSFVGGQFTSSAGLYTAVVSNTMGITLTDRSGAVEGYFPLGALANAGRLRSIADRNGNTLRFAYDGQGRLVTVTDTLNRIITYTYDANNRIINVTDFAGRTVTLAYDANGDLVSVTTPAVIGTPNGNDFPTGKTTRFAYSSGSADERLNHNLTHIIAPNEVADGSLTPRTINTYGTGGVEFDRVVSQSWGGGRANASGIPAGGTVTLMYTTAIAADAPPGAASQTTITDRGGNVLELWHDGAGHRLRARQWVSGQWLVTDYAYNADGQIAKVSYPAGNAVEYTYDEGAANPLARGNLLQESRLPDAARGCDGLGSAPCAPLVTTFTYEPTFQLVSSRTDARGHRTAYTYDARGNVTQAAFPTVTLGLAAPQTAFESWTYNAWGQPLTYTDAEGNLTRYEYYAAGPATGYRQRVIQASGSLDITTAYGYDLVGNATVVTDPLGTRTDFVFNALNQIVKVSRAAGTALDYETLYWYDANDNLIRVDIENVVPDLDANWQPTGTHSRDAANPWWTTTYVYDLLDNRVRQVVEVSSVVTREHRYDALERLVSTTYPEGNRIEYAYDERNQLRQVTRGAGTAEAATTTYAHDANGNLVRQTDGEGRPTDYFYDGFDRQVGSVDALGNVRITEYDANGNVTASRLYDGQEGRNPGRLFDAAGIVLLSASRSSYDERNRPYLQEGQFFTADVATGVITPLTADGDGDAWVETAYRYDRNGNTIQVLDDGGRSTQMAYDAGGRLVQRTDALSNTTQMSYDDNGNMVRSVSGERQPEALVPTQSFTATNTYDALNRVVQMTDNLGRASRYAYDSRDNLVFSSDANGALMGATNDHGNTTLFSYDGLSRQLSATYHLRTGGVGSGPVIGQVTMNYEYDGNGRLVRQLDPEGNATAWAYDALDRTIRTTHADGATTVYSYDRAGNVVGYTDPNGSTVTVTWDGLNRRTRNDINRGAGVEGTTLQTFAWDGLSRLVAATDNNDPATAADDTALAFAYDSLSNLRRETQDGFTAQSTHNGMGNRLTLTYPGGFTLTYTYDALHRLKTIADSGGTLASYTYMGPWRVLRRINGNGTYSTYAYDAAQQVTAVEHRHSSDNALLSGFAYTYDRNGNCLSETAQPGGQTVNYTYDSMNQLTAAASPTFDGQYSYDGAGNRVQTTQNGATTSYTSTVMNEYAAIGEEIRTHDQNGNLIRRTAAGSAPLPGDLDADCDVDIVDIMLVASHWGTLLGDPGYDVRYDLDSDGDIDIVDIMRVAVHWGDTCGAAPPIPLAVINYRYDFANRLLGVTRVVTTTPDGNVQVVTDTMRFTYNATDGRTTTQATSGTVRYAYAHGQVVEERDGAGLLTASYVPGLALNRSARLWYQADALGSVRALADGTGTIMERVDYDPYGVPAFSSGGSASAQGNPYLFRGQRYDADSSLYAQGGWRYDAAAGRFLQPGSQTLGNTYTFASNNPLAIFPVRR